ALTTELSPDLPGRVRKHRRDQEHDLAQPFVGGRNDGFEIGPASRVLCQLPRLVVAYEFVYTRDRCPCALQRPREVQTVKLLVEACLGLLDCDSHLGSVIPESRV